MGFMKDVGKGLLEAAPVIGPVVGGILQNRAAGQARESTERANAEALAFSREQAAADQAYRQQLMDTWLAQRNAALQYYGLSIPSLGAGASPGAPGPGSVPGAVPRGAPPPAAASPAGVSPGGVAPTGLQALAAPTQAAPVPLGAWNDWARLGLRR